MFKVTLIAAIFSPSTLILIQDMFSGYTTYLSCSDPNNYCQASGAVSYWNTDNV